MSHGLIPEDAAHPDSYRPDLPLRSELTETDEFREAYDEGYGACSRRAESRVEALEAQLATSRAETRALQAQLAAKAS